MREQRVLRLCVSSCVVTVYQRMGPLLVGRAPILLNALTRTNASMLWSCISSLLMAALALLSNPFIPRYILICKKT